MNYSSIDSNDSMQFGPTQSSPQQISPSQNTQQPSQSPQPISTALSLPTKPNAIKSFLNENKGTLLMAAMGLSIGFAFKDFVKEFIESIINSIVYVVTKKSMGGTLHFNAFKLFNSFISLILVITMDYYIYKLI